MGLLSSRLQEIIGEKIFRHKVTFDKDVVFKQHITAYSPVSGEPSLGTPHPRGTDPDAWDVDGIASTTYTLASPYTWDLSGVLPVGAKAIEITLYVYYDTIAAKSASEFYCWQYELGTSPAGVAVAGPKGLIARVSKMTACDYAYDYLYAQNDGKILLGPSRKLYLGFPNNTGHTGYAMWKFYYS